MMIKKYKDFSVNEAKVNEDEEYDVRQICADLVEDHGFEIEISKRFANAGGASSDSPNTDFKFPFISIYLTARKEGKEEVEEQRALDLISAIYECVGKLSELGEAKLKKIELVNQIMSGSKKYNQEKVIIHVMQEEEAEVSDKQGFYDFAEKMRSAFNNHSNKVTKAYSVEIGNGIVKLVPKEDLIFHPPLTAVKSFLRSKFSPDHNTYGFNMLREYTYAIQSQDGKIKIDYEGYYNLARGRRQGELVK